MYMKRLTLLNSPVLTTYGKFEFEKVSIEKAKKIIHQAEKVESAIGHSATAEVITKTLGFQVEMSRIEFHQMIGDIALVFKLKRRPEEGKILNVEDIKKIGFDFGLLKRVG